MTILDYLKIGLGALAALAVAVIWNETIDNPSVRREALKGYVLQSEKVAAETRADEMERQRNAVSATLEEYRRRAAAAAISEQQKEEAREREIRDYEIRLDQAQRACRLDDADIEFLRKP